MLHFPPSGPFNKPQQQPACEPHYTHCWAILQKHWNVSNHSRSFVLFRITILTPSNCSTVTDYKVQSNLNPVIVIAPPWGSCFWDLRTDCTFININAVTRQHRSASSCSSPCPHTYLVITGAVRVWDGGGLGLLVLKLIEQSITTEQNGRIANISDFLLIVTHLAKLWGEEFATDDDKAWSNCRKLPVRGAEDGLDGILTAISATTG